MENSFIRQDSTPVASRIDTIWREMTREKRDRRRSRSTKAMLSGVKDLENSCIIQLQRSHPSDLQHRLRAMKIRMPSICGLMYSRFFIHRGDIRYKIPYFTHVVHVLLRWLRMMVGHQGETGRFEKAELSCYSHYSASVRCHNCVLCERSILSRASSSSE